MSESQTLRSVVEQLARGAGHRVTSRADRRRLLSRGVH
jgi:hypothetical protein